MKTLTLLVSILALATPALCQSSPTAHKPIVRDGYVMRTIQQDAELKDWITGAMAENERNRQRCDEAEVALEKEKQHGKELQRQIDAQAQALAVQTSRAMAAEKQVAVEKANVVATKKEAHENAKERDVVLIGFAIFFAVSLGSLIRKLAAVFSPYGIAIQFAAYILALGGGYGIGRYALFELAKFIP